MHLFCLTKLSYSIIYQITLSGTEHGLVLKVYT